MSSGIFPSKIVIGVGDLVAEARLALKDKVLPTADTDVVLENLVDVVQFEETADKELDGIMSRLHRNEVLRMQKFADFEGLDDSEMDHYVFAMENCRLRLSRLGSELKQQIKRFDLFIDGELKYEYDRLLDDSTIVLRSRR